MQEFPQQPEEEKTPIASRSLGQIHFCKDYSKTPIKREKTPYSFSQISVLAVWGDNPGRGAFIPGPPLTDVPVFIRPNVSLASVTFKIHLREFRFFVTQRAFSIIWPAFQEIATDWLSQIRQKWNKRERMYIGCTKLRRSAEREIVDSRPTHHVSKLKKPETSAEFGQEVRLARSSVRDGGK